MATMVHPFIRANTLHSARVARPAPASRKPAAQTVEEYEVDIPARGMGRKTVIMGSVAGLALAIAGSIGAMMYGSSSAQGNQAAAEPDPNVAARIQIDGPRIVNNQIPENYPGIYPGEQIVIYHLAPLANEATTEETDDQGCLWLRVTGKTSGLMAYPKIGDDDRQVCTDPSKAVAPLQARMVKDALPEAQGSTLRIIDIIDAKTGSSVVGISVPPLDTMIGQTPDQTIPQMALQSPPPPAGMMALGNIPSQAAPARQAPISTASDASNQMPAPTIRQAAVRQTPARSEPRQLEPIRRAEPYVPPADDVMVPLSGGNGTNELRAIRPGDQPRPSTVRRADTPSGSPMEGYASISGSN